MEAKYLVVTNYELAWRSLNCSFSQINIHSREKFRFQFRRREIKSKEEKDTDKSAILGINITRTKMWITEQNGKNNEQSNQFIRKQRNWTNIIVDSNDMASLFCCFIKRRNSLKRKLYKMLNIFLKWNYQSVSLWKVINLKKRNISIKRRRNGVKMSSTFRIFRLLFVAM